MNQIIIKNHAQLTKIFEMTSLLHPSFSPVFSGRITFKIDLFEFLSNDSLTIQKPECENSAYVDFLNENKINTISYYQKHNVMTEYHSDFDENITLSNCSTITPFNNDTDLENAERAFLTLLNFDLTNGYMSEDIEHFRETRNNIYFIVFGEK
jgi:hypothetical protein